MRILACRNLTKKYYKSEDIKKDIDKAMHYYLLAASYNDIQVFNEIDVEFKQFLQLILII